jgi:hypothetical protein
VATSSRSRVGSCRWRRSRLRTYDGDNFFPDGQGHSGALSPDGATLYATGTIDSRHNSSTTTTIAYDTALGDRLWTSRIREESAAFAKNAVVEAASDESDVVVAATDVLVDGSVNLLIAHYGPAHGAERWVRRDPMGDHAAAVSDLALSPDGDLAYVRGQGSPEPGALAGWFAVAYDTATGGAPTWIRSIPLSDPDLYAIVARLAVGPDGGRVFLTGDRDLTLTTEALVQP